MLPPFRRNGNSQRLRHRRDFAFVSEEDHRDGSVVPDRRRNRENSASVRFPDFGDDGSKAFAAKRHHCELFRGSRNMGYVLEDFRFRCPLVLFGAAAQLLKHILFGRDCQPLFRRIYGKRQLPVFQLELGRNSFCASLTCLPDAREQAEFALAQRLRDRLQLFGIPFGTSGLPTKRTRYDKCGDQGEDVKVPALFTFHDVLLFEVRSKTAPWRVTSKEPFVDSTKSISKQPCG